jgi:hypothetical protein
MVDRRGGNQQIHIANLLPIVPWELTPEDGEPLHDLDSQGQHIFLAKKGPQPQERLLGIARSERLRTARRT